MTGPGRVRRAQGKARFGRANGNANNVCALSQNSDLRPIILAMAKNTGSGSRNGAIKERVQALNPVTKRYVKIDTSTGRIIDHKKTAGPYKGVREVNSKQK
jgi:hypothetical protein